jgi:hypothetical protein
VTKETDYITINPAVAHGKYNVCVMQWKSHDDNYQVFRISAPLTAAAADVLAKSWAAATRLEIR